MNRAQRSTPSLLLLVAGCFSPDPALEGSSTGSSGLSSSTLTDGTAGLLTSTGAGSTNDSVETSSSTDSSSTSTGPSQQTSTGRLDTSGTGDEMNAAPVAEDDRYSTLQDTVLELGVEQGVLSNDSDLEREALVVSLIDGGLSGQTERGGTVDLESTGALVYLPPAGFWGEDSFQYRVEDNAGGVDLGTVEFAVGPIEIPLAEVAAGQGGFAIDGDAGVASTAADMNLDGRAEIIIGRSGSGGVGQTARFFVVFGRDAGNVVELEAIGNEGFSIQVENFVLGQAEGLMHDQDGDGIVDFGFGGPGGLGNSGIVFGTPDSTTVTFGAGTGTVVDGSYLLRPAGDFNNDGAQDVLSLATNPLSASDVSIHFGPNFDDPPAVRVVGFSSADSTRPYHAGDINGDGVDDLVLGNPSNGAERCVVVFGDAGVGGVIDINALGEGGFEIESAPGTTTNLGRSVARVGDLNGDGRDDLAVGVSHLDFEGMNSGRVYVVFGKADAEPVSLFALGSGGFPILGLGAQGQTGRSLASAGDVNGDGLQDIVVGGIYNAALGGDRAHVVYGKATTAPVSLSALEGLGFTILAETDEGAPLGDVVAGGRDINGDGLSDVIVVDADAEPNGDDTGRSYVVFGTASQ